MIVQTRSGNLRLIRQHDHALASGRLAHEWTGTSSEPAPLSHEAVLAIALHDLSWREADRAPRRNAATGEILSFETWPVQERIALYSAGLDEVERIHPYAGLLGSLHYGGFLAKEHEDFGRREAARRDRLRAELGPAAPDEARVRSDLAWLRFFDLLSLFICLTGPAAVRAAPDWLAAAKVGAAPAGIQLALRWAEEDTLLVDPFPFRAPVDLRIPCRDLPLAPFSTDEALRAAWDAAPPASHDIRITRPPPGPASDR